MIDQTPLATARAAKAKADSEQALIDKLPELERREAAEQQRIQDEINRQTAQSRFEEAMKIHRSRGAAHNAAYETMLGEFIMLVEKLKADNRSFDNVNKAAYPLAYIKAKNDPVWGLTTNSVNGFQQQLLIDNDIQQMALPQAHSPVEEVFYRAILEAIST